MKEERKKEVPRSGEEKEEREGGSLEKVRRKGSVKKMVGIGVRWITDWCMRKE
jgi:hypothetical protein